MSVETGPDSGVISITDGTAARIVEAAAKCFYRDGIYATGVDALAAEAGVSKRTLYNHFGSKDAVIAAYLRQREEQWHERLSGIWAEVGDDAVAQVISYVRGYTTPHDLAEVFRGSAFINAAAELADEEHEALGVIQDSMATMESGIRRILMAAGYADAEHLATTILIVIEGAVAVAGVRREAGLLGDAERIIGELLERAETR